MCLFGLVDINVSDFSERNLPRKEKLLYTNDTVFINYRKLSLNFIIAEKILYINTILFEMIRLKLVFPIHLL
jgi:hypothetical protein